MDKAGDIPSKGMKAVYLSIIASLVINSIIFGGLAFAFTGGEKAAEQEILRVEVLPEDVQIPTPQEIADNYQEIRNVTASRRAKYSNTVSNYSSRSQSRMQAQIDADLAALEQQVIDELREKGIGPEEVEKVEKRTFDEDVYAPKDGDESSYASAVVTYDLGARNDRKLPVPAYKCKQAGTVVIAIEVSAVGEVKTARLLEEKSTSNECLIAEAMKSARASLFNSAGAKKEEGTITYQFLRQ